MILKKLRWRVAALVAFLMGIPMVEQARADDVGDIVDSVFSLVYSILNVAGDS